MEYSQAMQQTMEYSSQRRFPGHAADDGVSAEAGRGGDVAAAVRSGTPTARASEETADRVGPYLVEG